MVLGAVATAGIASAAILSQSALAYRGNPEQVGPNYDPARHEAMENAFNSRDYNSWKDLMKGRGRVTERINEQNFSKFAEMRKLMLEKKYDEANKLRAELGLGQGNGRDQGNGANFANRNGNKT